MRLAHRSVHRAIWPVLGIVVGLGLVLALILRPPPPLPDTNEIASERQR
jgi:hypothetical protein